MSVVKSAEPVSKKEAELIAKEIETAISEILKKHNLKTEKQSVKYGTAFQYKIDAVAVELVGGVNMASVEAQQWVTNAGWAFDVVNAEDVIGAEVSINKTTYKLGGCKINKTKPILLIDIKTNKEYYAPKEVLTHVKGIKLGVGVSA
jgi:hypothetical protein